MFKKILILIAVIVMGGCIFYGLEMIKTSKKVIVDLETSENDNVKEIKQEVDNYNTWDNDAYEKIKAKITLKSNMKNINFQEKQALNTIIDNKNAINIREAFANTIKKCKLDKELNNEINRISKIKKYENEFISEKKTTKNFKYIKRTLEPTIYKLCELKYNEKAFNKKKQLINRYFTNEVRKCNEMRKLKTTLETKMNTFQSIGISFNQLDDHIRNESDYWSSNPFPNDTTGKIYYYNNYYDEEDDFEEYGKYTFYKKKLRSLNIMLNNGKYLYQ